MGKDRLRPEQAKNKSHRVATSGDIEVGTYLEIAKEIAGEQPVMPKEAISPVEREAIIVIDFGSQYSMLIARRVRECQVYCELVSHDTPWDKIASLNPKGFILSGGPASVYDSDAPLAPAYVYESRLPILGICYGMQVLTKQLVGQVTPGAKREYGHAVLHLSDVDSPLFANLPSSSPVWMGRSLLHHRRHSCGIEHQRGHPVKRLRSVLRQISTGPSAERSAATLSANPA